MIRNTCLTGGSFDDDPLGRGVRPTSRTEPPSLPAELGALLPDGAGVLAAAAGVGRRSRSGRRGFRRRFGSGRAAGRTGSAVEPTDAVACGRISLTGARADAASVSVTRGLAASPTSTPKPRNTSTSSAETRGEGSVRPERGARPRGRRAPRPLQAAPVAGARPPGSPRRSCSSRGLRAPTRAPQSRQ